MRFSIGIFIFFSSLYCADNFAIIGPCRTMDNSEYEMRIKASKIIFSIYLHLNKIGEFPLLDEKTRTQQNFNIPDTWEVTTASHKNSVIRFIMPKREEHLSESIRGIKSFTDRLVCDCTAAAEITKHAVMSSLFSDIRVNHIRSVIIRELGGESLKSEVIKYIYDDFSSVGYIYQVQICDFLYIFGHPDYDKYSIGYGRGENVFCIGFKGVDILCVGFGPLFKDGPKTIEQIQESLAQNYAEVSPEKNVEEALAIIKQQPLLRRAFAFERIQRALTNPNRK